MDTNLDNPLRQKAKINLLLVSGVSGAGKTTVASTCEEQGYYVTEDLPIALLSSLLEIFKRDPARYGKVALFVNINDIREAGRLVQSDPAFQTKLVGLDCSIDVLLMRYRLTRHIHPLQPKGYSLNQAINADAVMMEETRKLYDFYVDTSGLTEKALRVKMRSFLTSDASRVGLIISSFGYKYGLPRDAEIVIDARVLANPYWVPELCRLTGLDEPVREYIESDPKTKVFLTKLFSLLEDYLNHAIEEGRPCVIVDVGCSGGQHRSVYVADKIYMHFRDNYQCTLFHRELSRYMEDEAS